MRPVSTASSRVAPITGAWIETVVYRSSTGLVEVAPITGAWIETSWRSLATWCLRGRPHHGGVDRNIMSFDAGGKGLCRPHHGGVDRNHSVE